jgi:hypothetical protein
VKCEPLKALPAHTQRDAAAAKEHTAKKRQKGGGTTQLAASKSQKLANGSADVGKKQARRDQASKDDASEDECSVDDTEVTKAKAARKILHAVKAKQIKDLKSKELVLCCHSLRCVCPMHVMPFLRGHRTFRCTNSAERESSFSCHIRQACGSVYCWIDPVTVHVFTEY